MEKVRRVVVAGYFYPDKRSHLLRMLEEFIEENVEKEKAKAVVVPHAGYIYSGKTAGTTYSRVVIPETVIILGPNHTGYGEPFAVSSHEKWETPIGEVEIDKEIVKKLIEKSRYLEEDTVAHEKEHSIEVQIPFLQVLKKDVKIVPITLEGYVDNPAWIEIGESIGEVIKESGKEILIVASSDMTHYEVHNVAEEKDNYAIEAIKLLDENLLIERIYEKNISMCGYAPVIIAIVASKYLGAKEGKLIRYSTSAETSGDYGQVVGYAGIVIV